MSATVPVGRRLPPSVVILAGCLFVSLTCELYPVGVQSELAAGLDASRSRIGLLVTWYAVAAAVATLPAVPLAGRFDPRVALAAGMVVLGAFQVGFSSSHGVLAAGLWRAGSALTHGLVWSQAPVFVARLLPPARQGRATSLVLLGASFGLLAGAPLSAALARGVGWRAARCRPRPHGPHRGDRLVTVLPGAASVDSTGGRSTRDLSPAHRPPPRWAPILTVCAATVVLVVGHYVSYAFLEPLSARAGLGGSWIVAALAAYGAAGLAGAWLVGRSLDKRPCATAVVGCTLPALGLLAMVAGVPVVVVPAILVWGSAAGALPAWLNTAALRADTDRADLASGAYVVAYQIGISIGAAVGAGVLVAASLAALPITSAAVVACGALVVLASRPVLAAR